MEDLSELLKEVQPVHDHLIQIWEKLPPETLAAEQERLTDRLLDIGGRLIALSQVREKM